MGEESEHYYTKILVFQTPGLNFFTLFFSFVRNLFIDDDDDGNKDYFCMTVSVLWCRVEYKIIGNREDDRNERQMRIEPSLNFQQ